MAECQVCHAKLLTEGLSSGQQFRCANCQSFSRYGTIDKVAADRLAWRSFWLGIASILLLTLTGIPAIYYGVRSLLRMRFVKPKRSDQAAAIIGTTLGGFFGVLVGFITVGVVLATLLRIWTSTETELDTEVVKQCSQFFEFSHPDVIPIRAKTALGTQYLFEFSDQENAELQKLRVRLVFLRKGIQPNEMVISQLLWPKQLNDQALGRQLDSKVLDWKIDGQSVEVKRLIYTRKPKPEPADSLPPPLDPETNRDGPESGDGVRTGTGVGELESPKTENGVLDLQSDTRDQTHHYYGYLPLGKGFYGVAVSLEPEGCGLTESDVQTMFASIGLVDTLSSSNSGETEPGLE